MEVCRLDLGVEVAYVPTRDLLVIHPDLGYAEALGAVMGTIPDLHPDAAVALVDKVTPRPEPEPPMLKRATVAGMRATLAAAIAAGLVTILGIGTATPAAAFGETWAAQMAARGMECERVERSVAVCIAGEETVVQVQGFRRHQASLYMLSSEGDASFMLVFDTDHAADKFAGQHPEVEMAGRVAVW